MTPNRRGSEKAHRGASAATHLAAVTPVACMASGGAPSGVRARAKFATTRSTRETRGVECGECAARPLGDLSRNNEAENREMTWNYRDTREKEESVPPEIFYLIAICVRSGRRPFLLLFAAASPPSCLKKAPRLPRQTEARLARSRACQAERRGPGVEMSPRVRSEVHGAASSARATTARVETAEGNQNQSTNNASEGGAEERATETANVERPPAPEREPPSSPPRVVAAIDLTADDDDDDETLGDIAFHIEQRRLAALAKRRSASAEKRAAEKRESVERDARLLFLHRDRGAGAANRKASVRGK